MTAGSTFAITGIPKAKDAKWIRHNTPQNGRKIPYVQNIPARYEITEWGRDVEDSPEGSELRKQWTLFILGLDRFMKMEIADKLSYFQIAGIHGFPLQPWDNAPPPVPDTKPGEEEKPGDNPENGYCHHNTVAFPTWHRPYLMLYEQCIWLNMQALINEEPLPNCPDFPNYFQGLSPTQKDEWKAAADNWRLPYWDWARKQYYGPTNTPDRKYVYPEVCTVSKVPIFLANGETKAYPNPLEKFECPEKDDFGKPVKFGQVKNKEFRIKDDDRPKKYKKDALPWGQCTATSRYGITRDVMDQGEYVGLNGENAWNRGNNAIAKATEHFYYLKRGKDKDAPVGVEKPSSLGDAVNRMFAEKYIGTWGEFASTKWYKEEAANITTGYMSLEYIHNNLHNLSGGSRLRPDPKIKDDDWYGLGHMSEVPVAAFDPIFWLHHGNVDRLCAMWQALYWDKWWDRPEPKDPDGKHDYDRVTDKKPDEALEPFHKGVGEDGKALNWDSNACRDWTVGGYTYDTLIPSEAALEEADGPLDEEMYKKLLRLRITRYYSSVSSMAYKLRKEGNPAALYGRDAASRADAFQDYIINIVYDRYALDGLSYSIQFYLSRYAPGDDVGELDVKNDEEDFVGSVYSFGGGVPAAESSSGCANCGGQQAKGTLSKAQIAITAPLLLLANDERENGLTKMNRKNVQPFLDRNLYWKYIGPGGDEISEAYFPQTSVIVFAGLGKSVRETAGAARGELFSTPLFAAYDDGEYAPLLDAMKSRRDRLNLEEGDPALSFATLSVAAERVYTEDEW